MKTISIINLKGGVGKTISAINIAYILAAVHHKRVLLIDNDKQGNTSKFFGVHSYDAPSISEILTDKAYNIEFTSKRIFCWFGDHKQMLYEEAQKKLLKENIKSYFDVLPANMNLLKANKDILLDCSRPQQTRLKKALDEVRSQYDYCVIDNAPDINMSVINALVASDDVLIPIKVDRFAFDGLDLLTEQIEELRDFNERLTLKGCFITMFQRNNVNKMGEQYLKDAPGIPIFNTVIRKTVKVDETTFNGKPLLAYSRNSTAARDYVALVEEYLGGNQL